MAKIFTLLLVNKTVNSDPNLTLISPALKAKSYSPPEKCTVKCNSMSITKTEGELSYTVTVNYTACFPYVKHISTGEINTYWVVDEQNYSFIATNVTYIETPKMHPSIDQSSMRSSVLNIDEYPDDSNKLQAVLKFDCIVQCQGEETILDVVTTTTTVNI